MRILITGAAGFIASQIQDRYLELGHEVAVVDSLVGGFRSQVHPKSRFDELDIRSPEVEAVFRDFRPEVLNLHAAQMDVRRSVADPLEDCDINGMGMLRLLQLAHRYGTRKIVFASSGGAVYGEQEWFPADERHSTFPQSPYGITKMLGDHYLRFYQEQHGLKTVSLRYANVYGPRQNPHGEAGVVAIFISKILRGETPTIYGNGEQTRDFVYVGDVVEANVLALGEEASGVYNIGTGVETSVCELYRCLAELLRHTAPAHFAEAKPGEQLRSVISSAKIEAELGWRPRVDLRQGLAATINYFRSKDPVGAIS